MGVAGCSHCFHFLNEPEIILLKGKGPTVGPLVFQTLSVVKQNVNLLNKHTWFHLCL